MNSKLIALASAAVIALTAVAIPNQAEARWRGGGWWIPGAVVGGLALGALAARPYYYGPGYYGYAYGPGPYYGGYGYGAYDYEYGQYYDGGPHATITGNPTDIGPSSNRAHASQKGGAARMTARPF
jgi:hypothetical protein